MDGFESNCAEYDIGNKHAKIRMENDCLIHCSNAIEKDEIKVKFSITMFDLIRRDVLSSFGNKSINLKRYGVNLEQSDNCLEKCKTDCNSKRYFIKDYDVINKMSSLTTQENTMIEFEHNSMPDIIVRHTFEMTLMSFVCNFGGLLGMWLGLSILSISKDIFECFQSFRQFITIKIINPININQKIFNISITNNLNATSKSNNEPMVEIEL